MSSFRTPMAAVALAAAAVAFLPGFLALAPNRLTSGAPVGLVQCAPLAAAVIAVAILSLAVSAWRGQAILGLAAGIVLLLATPLAAGTGAAALLRHAGPAARAELACGFWLLGAAAALAIITASAALRVKPSWRAALLAALAAALLLVVASGALNALSLAREYQSHRAAFRAAALRHLLLVGMTLAGALAAGMPLGLTAWRHKAWRPAIFAALNIIQTLPSIALFGLLMVPLARLGLSGIGLVPAVIALVLYALLPTVRAIVSGLENAPAAPLRAAGGVGFGRWQEFWHVRLPLAAPALLAGLRIVVVQAVGLAVVAALIGAGGFGDFVFQGLGQYATDLVLLGALPATAMALAADALLTLAASMAQGRTA